MEIKEILKELKKSLVFLLTLSLLGAVIGFYLSKNLENFPHAQLDVFISPPGSNISASNENYYNQEQARNFTDTAIVILESPDFANTIKGQNGSITAAKLAPQLIRITSQSETEEGAKNLLLNSLADFNRKLDTLVEGNQKLVLKPIAAEPRVFIPVINSKIVAMAGMIFGLAFALFVITLKKYFRL